VSVTATVTAMLPAEPETIEVLGTTYPLESQKPRTSDAGAEADPDFEPSGHRVSWRNIRVASRARPDR